MDRVTYLVSDLHLGPGRVAGGTAWDPLEDFTSGEQFATFLATIGTTGEPIELVIAGDFLEYPQTLPEIGLAAPADNLGSSEAESVRRTKVILGQNPEIASGHPEVFTALRRFMMEGNSVLIIAGNHDIDLLWDEVWALVFDTIYPPGSWGDLRRREYSYTVGSGTRGRIYIEHGHEHDKANRFGDRMTIPFALDQIGVRRLKRCWGTLFVDKVYNLLERDRWFIDNVKPIPRVLNMGLRNDFLFTATAMGLLARFLLTSGLPPLLGGGLLGGSPEAAAPSTEEVVSVLADQQVRAQIEAQMHDPAFRAEFERAVAGMDAAEWGAVLGGAAEQTTLEQAAGEGGLLGGAGADADEYQRAARELLENDPAIDVVIMGHTHSPIDGARSPMDLPDGRTGLYFNSGTWTRHLKDESQRSYSWDELGDIRNYTTSHTYIRLEPDTDGAYRASMGNWAEEE